jgi:folate-dependent phosphoribosylglycinamide formyltransferase PurN
MRVVFFGSGSPGSQRALDAVAAAATVVAVVVPAARRGAGWRRRLARWRARRPLARRARALGAAVVPFRPGEEGRLASRLGALRPGLLCVATFPFLLPAEVLALSPALGLHPSLLPRRRGPDPLFWAYYEDDRETGVTVFLMDASEDAGPIVAQEPVALPRGRRGIDLYDEIARRGAALMGRAVADAASGRLQGRAQNRDSATRQGAPGAGQRVALAGCDREWLWHFLGGVGPHRPFVRAEDGAALLHGVVRAHAAGPARPAGSVERVNGAWRLHCRDGYVEVAPAAPWRALRERLARRGTRVLG